MEKIRFALTLVILMAACHVSADRYKVLYVNSTGIKIETKNVVVGLVFSDKDKIVWANEQQAMKVINLSTNRIMVLAAKALKKKKSSSLYEYLTSTKHLSTRNLRNRHVIEEWQLDSTLYLLDTLYIRIPLRQKTVATKIVLKDNEGKTIPLDSKRGYYIITRDIWGNLAPHLIRIDIKEYDKEQNWEYTVYRNLIIEPLMIQSR